MITIDAYGGQAVSSELWDLTASERMAVIAHEAGHKHHGHIRQQWIALFCFQSVAVHTAMLHRQELEADQFARSMGYGAALASYLSRYPMKACRTHPATAERIAKLTK